MTILLWCLVILAIVIGVVGTVVPIIPGVTLIYAGMVGGAWLGSFQQVGLVRLVILALLMGTALALDFIATSLGAKRAGASKLAIAGAAVGTIAGIFFLLPGIILGPFIGAVIGEWFAGKDLPQIGKAGFGTWIGLLLGAVAKLAVAFIMVGIFALAYF